MNPTFGPWSTAMGMGNHPELSTFWKRRMTMLCRISQDKSVVRRRTLLGLVAVGALTCLVPTLRDVPAHAQQKEQQDTGKAKLSGRIYAPADMYTSRYGANERKHQRMFIAIDPETGEWEKIGNFTGQFRISPDGQTIAFKNIENLEKLQEGPGIWIADVNDLDNPRKVLEVGGGPIWSRDGREIVTTDENGTPDEDGFTNVTWRANRDGTNLRKLPVPATDRVIDWSPDGQWLLTFRHFPKEGFPKEGKNEWYLMRTDGSEKRRLARGGNFSPDGRHLLYQYDYGDIQLLGREIRVFDLETGEHRTVYRAQTDFLARVNWSGWSPDGKHIALVVVNWEARFRIRPNTADCRFVILDADGGKPREFRLPDARNLWIVRAQWQ